MEPWRRPTMPSARRSTPPCAPTAAGLAAVHPSADGSSSRDLVREDAPSTVKPYDVQPLGCWYRAVRRAGRRRSPHAGRDLGAGLVGVAWIPVAIATSRGRASVHQLLGTGWSGRFVAVITCDDVAAGKPILRRSCAWTVRGSRLASLDGRRHDLGHQDGKERGFMRWGSLRAVARRLDVQVLTSCSTTWTPCSHTSMTRSNDGQGHVLGKLRREARCAS